MDSSAGAYPLRPMNISEIIDAVFRLYRANLWLFAAVAAVIQIPYQLLLTFVQGQSGSLTRALSSLPSGARNSHHVQLLFLTYWHGSGLAVLALALFGLLALPLDLAAMTSAGAERYQGRPTSLQLAFQVARRRWLPLMGVFLLMILILIGAIFALAIVGTLLTVVLKALGVLLLVLLCLTAVTAGIIASVRLIVTIPVVVLEPAGPLQAMQRSWSLIRGHSWFVIGVVLVLTLIVGFSGLVLGVIAGLLAALAGGVATVPGHVITAATSLVISVLFAPVTSLGVMLLYFNLRGRKEGSELGPTVGQPALGV